MTPWDRAITALQLLQVDPKALGGIVVKARSGPVREQFLSFLPPYTRLHPALAQDALTGGVDATASLAGGTIVRHAGLLARGGMMLLPMAERTPPMMASTLAHALDTNKDLTVVALDESTEDEEPPSITLTDRLAFHVSLEGLAMGDIGEGSILEHIAARKNLPRTSEEQLSELAALAVALGITSLRAPLHALNAARAHAALAGRSEVADEDIRAAAELVLAPRATRIPEEATPEEQPSPPEQESNEAESLDGQFLPDEMLLAAIKTALPPDLLTGAEGASRSAKGSGAGARRIGNRRGRPLPPRDGGSRASQARVDIPATLRAAVPWQKLRRAHAETTRAGPIIRPEDLRYKRFEAHSDRLLIFAVDASGSAALARLAEAKGAVELLLAEAYARRDHVSLIAFRGDHAETLLPPTRSLVQTKRRLAELPGGGGTPLASGLSLSLETAVQARRKGMDPVIIVLTDGRSNVTLEGAANRAQAAEDAQRMARSVASEGVETIVIDTSRRPEPQLQQLARSAHGRYTSLPRADAQSLSRTVTDHLGA